MSYITLAVIIAASTLISVSIPLLCIKCGNCNVKAVAVISVTVGIFVDGAALASYYVVRRPIPEMYTNSVIQN